MIVVDASVALAWFLESNESSFPALQHVEELGGVVPGNFHSELVHGFLNAERRKRIHASEAVRSLDAILDLWLDVRFPDPKHVMAVAREHQLTGYDAAYLTLAMEQGLRLASRDAALRQAATAAHLLWEPA